MHPYLMAQIANEHIKDMRHQASAAQRARDARRARRALMRPRPASRQQPCPDLTIRPA